MAHAGRDLSLSRKGPRAGRVLGEQGLSEHVEEGPARGPIAKAKAKAGRVAAKPAPARRGRKPSRD